MHGQWVTGCSSQHHLPGLIHGTQKMKIQPRPIYASFLENCLTGLHKCLMYIVLRFVETCQFAMLSECKLSGVALVRSILKTEVMENHWVEFSLSLVICSRWSAGSNPVKNLQMQVPDTPSPSRLGIISIGTRQQQ